MKKSKLSNRIIAGILLTGSIFVSAAHADTLSTDNISMNEQSSIRIEGSKIVYFDPFHIQEETHDADVISITHEHYDHLDPDSLQKVMRDDTVIFAPASIESSLKECIGNHTVYYFVPGETKTIEDMTVEAVPAYNMYKSFHPKKKNWLGYIITMDDVRYYVAGDTDAVDELYEVDCTVAFVPIGGTYTMDPVEAAELINVIKPQITIPTHYGTIVGNMDDGETFREYVDDDIEVKLLLS